MIKPNMHYADLKDSYLFAGIAQKVKKYQEANPDKHIYRMGIVWQNVSYNQPPHLGYYLPDLFK